MKGKHEALISFDTFERIQDRLTKKAKAPARKDINQDFPLRGFVTCSSCDVPMTSGWSRGSMGVRYPYYLCQQKGCNLRGKSIRRDKVEQDFEQLLGELKPSEQLFIMAIAMFTDMWDEKRKNAKLEAETIRREMTKVEKKVEQFFERIVEADSPTLITAYENQIKKLEKDKIRMDESIARCGRPVMSCEDTFRTALTFLSNPLILWRSDALEHKRTVLKLTFSDKLVYDKNEGFRTPAKSCPFSLLEDLRVNNVEMVPLGRIELPTSSLPMTRSTTELQRLT